MYTNGLKDRFGSPLISKRDGDAIYATKETVDGLFGREFITAENATGTNECNAIQFAAAKIPHNIDIDEVSIPVINGHATPLYLAAWYINQNNQKTYIGLSDNAVAWQAGTNAVWKFTNNPLNVPDNCKLELFLTANAPAAGATEIGGGWVQINCYVNYSGSGSIRYGHDWYSGRDILAYFTQVGHVIGNDIHINATQKEALKDVVDGKFTKDNANVESSWLVDCPGEGETCGTVINPAHIPHDIEINKITLYLNQTNTNDPTYIYVLLANNGVVTRVGLSDEGMTWTEKGLVTWKFNNNSFTIPSGASVYLYFTNDPDSATVLSAPSVVKHLNIRYRELSNSGSMRYYDKWYDNRLVYVIFTETNNEYLEEKFLDAKYLTKEAAAEIYATKEDSKPYDWTPDWVHAIQSTNTVDYTAPTNGWVSTTEGSSYGQVLINGQLAGYNTTSGSYTMLLREGDQIHFDNNANFLFAPCNAEQEDWREVKTNYDIWKNAICYDSNGTPYVQNLWIPIAAEWAENIRIPHGITITKVEDERAYNGENFVCNIQSTEIENATFLFYGFNVNGVDTVCPIQTWDSDLNKLKSGGYMFCRSNLNSFTGNLDSLTRGYQMFYNSKLANFSTPMPEVVNGYLMFATNSLTNFNVAELPKLSNGEGMFAYTNISSYTTDMPKLSNAREMFMSTPSLTTFDADLSNLKTGWKMFGEGSTAQSKLSTQSIKNIANSIKDIKGMAKNDDSLWKYDTVDTYGTVKPNAGTIGYDYRGILHLTCDSNAENGAASALQTIVGKGWTVYVNGNIYEGGNFTIYDISEANGYAPDASRWYDEVLGTNFTLLGRLSKVEDGKAYDLSGNFLFNIESDKITNGTNMMYAMEVGEWVDELPLLQNGTQMFNSVTTSKIDCGNTQNLTNGTYMFQNVKRSNKDSKVWNPVEIRVNIKNITNGRCMFASTVNGVKLVNGSEAGYFQCDSFDNVTNGESMFSNSYGLVNVDGTEIGMGYFNFASLQTGDYMFSNYIPRQSDLCGYINKKLKTGVGMFQYSNIANLRGNETAAPTNLKYACKGCKQLNEVCFYLNAPCDCEGMFEGCTYGDSIAGSSLGLNVDIVGTKFIKNGSSMFRNTKQLIYNKDKVIDLSGVTSCTEMFRGIPQLDLTSSSSNPIKIGSGSINTSYMFAYSCLYNNMYIDGTYITDAFNMFCGAKHSPGNLLVVNNLGSCLVGGGNCMGMFRQSQLNSVSVDLTYVKDASSMFENSRIHGYDINLIGDCFYYLTNASSMFANSYISSDNISGNLSTSYLNHSNPNFDTVITLNNMFANCGGLTEVPVGHRFLQMNEYSSAYGMFSHCEYLHCTWDWTGSPYVLRCSDVRHMFEYSGLYEVINLPMEVNNCGNMFSSCSALHTVTIKSNTAESAYGMFWDSYSLSNFRTESTWNNLKYAQHMFQRCYLNAVSVNNILNVMLPQAAYSNSYIDITMSNDGCAEVMRILKPTQSVTIPHVGSGSYYDYQTWKGWTLRLTCHSGDYTYTPSGSGGDGSDAGQYDVTEANGYIPDASSWNANCYTALTNAGLKITSVDYGNAYMEV